MNNLIFMRVKDKIFESLLKEQTSHCSSIARTIPDKIIFLQLELTLIAIN